MPEKRENVESKIWQNGNNNNNNNFQRSAVIQSQGTEGSFGNLFGKNNKFLSAQLLVYSLCQFRNTNKLASIQNE